MSQSLSRRSFLRYAGTGAVTLAAALLGGVSAAAQDTPCLRGEPALLDGKAAVELLGYADAPGLGGTLVYLSAENLSAHTLPVAPSYLQGRAIQTQEELYHTGSGLSVCCDGQPVPCGSFAAPLYNENAADASLFTLNLAAGRGAMIPLFLQNAGRLAAAGAAVSARLCRRAVGVLCGAPRRGRRRSGSGARQPCRAGHPGGPVSLHIQYSKKQRRNFPPLFFCAFYSRLSPA